MSDSIDSDPNVARTKNFTTYPLSSLFLLVLAIAISLGWWVDRSRIQNKPATSQYDINGPLYVSYEIRMTDGVQKKSGVIAASGICIHGETFTIHTESGGVLLSTASLVECSWTKRSID